MSAQLASLKEPRGVLYHGGALVYALGGYGLGMVGLFSPNWTVNGLSTVLLGHALVIAAYLIHECAHNTVFQRNRDNARLGTLLTWICGPRMEPTRTFATSIFAITSTTTTSAGMRCGISANAIRRRSGSFGFSSGSTFLPTTSRSTP